MCVLMHIEIVVCIDTPKQIHSFLLYIWLTMFNEKSIKFIYTRDLCLVVWSDTHTHTYAHTIIWNLRPATIVVRVLFFFFSCVERPSCAPSKRSKTEIKAKNSMKLIYILFYFIVLKMRESMRCVWIRALRRLCVLCCGCNALASIDTRL